MEITDGCARPAFMEVAGVRPAWGRPLRRAVGGDIYLRSVLSAHREQTATPVCDNHSWKMKSAVRQTNSINTYSGVEHSMDTDVRKH